ncbi:hypothetical protein BDZ89DRAFT_727471 [Hymenopellis radicata]|nr:hypothetical protein BDZ89DRAFT_727471 [Hymenopellis radicata]
MPHPSMVSVLLAILALSSRHRRARPTVFSPLESITASWSYVWCSAAVSHLLTVFEVDVDGESGVSRGDVHSVGIGVWVIVVRTDNVCIRSNLNLILILLLFSSYSHSYLTTVLILCLFLSYYHSYLMLILLILSYSYSYCYLSLIL